MSQFDVASGVQRAIFQGLHIVTLLTCLPGGQLFFLPVASADSSAWVGLS
jgi:hypothetical protein